MDKKLYLDILETVSEGLISYEDAAEILEESYKESEDFLIKVYANCKISAEEFYSIHQ